MAKRRRKRLNKPVLIILIVLGVLVTVAAAGAAYGFWRYGSAFPRRLVDLVFPKDPVACERRGDEAYEKGDYRTAAREYRTAANQTGGGVVCFKLGRALIELALTDQGLTDTERNEEYRKGLSWLRKATSIDPKYRDPQELLCDLVWQQAAREVRGSQEDSEATQVIGRRTSVLDRYVEAATKLLETGEHPEKDPRNRAIYYRRGLARVQLYYTVKGDHGSKAEEDLQAAVRLRPEEPRYWAALAEFLASVDKAKQARRTLVEGLQKNPDSPDLLVRHAELLWKVGQKDQARRQLEEAIARNPAQPEAYLALARVQIAEERLSLAEKTLRTAKQNLTDASGPPAAVARVYRMLAAVYHRMNRLDRAAEELRAGLKALAEGDKPDATPGARSRLGDDRWHMAYALASILLDRAPAAPDRRDELLTEARACLDKIRQLKPDDPHGANESARLRLKIAGRIAMAEGKADEAIRLLEQAWERFKNTSEQQTALLLASLYLARHRTSEAQGVLDRVLRRPGQRNNVRFLLAKARIRMKLRDHRGAADLVAQVLQHDPQNAEARSLDSALKALMGGTAKLPDTLANTRMVVRQLRDRAETLWFEDRRDEAVRLMEELHRRVPDDLGVVSYLVDLYLARRESAKAEGLLKAAAAKHPDNEALTFRLRLIREKDPARRLALRRQRAGQMRDAFRRALELADIARIQGKPAEHLARLAEAVRIKPDAPALGRYVLARAIAMEKWKIAEDCVALAAKADLDGTGGKLFGAHLAAARRQHARAIAALEEILKLSPQRAEARVLLGQCFFETNRRDRAEEAFRAVIKADPGYVQAVVGMARITETGARAKEHAEWVAKAFALAPRDRYVRQRHLAVRAHHAERDQIPALLAECDRLLRKTPPDRQLPIRIIRADLLTRSKQIREAEKEYLTVYEAYVRAGDPLTGGTLLVSFLVRTDQIGKADAAMRNLLKTASDRVGAYVLYGLALSAHSPQQALGAFSKALEADAKDPRPHLAISRHQQRQGNWKAAADAMKAYCDLRPDDLPRRKRLVLLRIEAGQTDLASRRVAEILQRAPDDAGALAIRGLLLRREGKEAEAARHFTRAAEAEPSNPLPLVLRAQLHLDRGLAREARADLDLARQRTTSEPTVLLQLALAYRRLGDLAAAEAQLSDLLKYQKNYLPALRRLLALYAVQEHWWKLEPKLAEARKANPQDVGFVRAQAQMWQARGKAAKALEALASAYRLAPKDPVVIQEYLQALLEAGKFGEVLQAAGAGVDRQDTGSWVRAARGRALAATGKEGEADADFLRAVREALPRQGPAVALQIHGAYGLEKGVGKLTGWIDHHPREWRLHACLGEVHALGAEDAGSSHLAGAVAAFGKAAGLAAKSDDKALVLKRLAYTCAAAGDPARAVRAYKDALKLVPDDVRALNNLSYLYTDSLNRPKEGLRYARRVFQLAPSDPNVLDTYGWTLAKLHEFDQAERRLHQAVLRGRPTAANRYHLGWVLEHKSDAELAEALTQYTQALVVVGREKDSALYGALARAIERVKRKMSAT